jgi:hypothetical protein
MTVHPHRLVRPQPHRFTHNANSAGAPLPQIPRRNSSTSSSPSIPPPPPPPRCSHPIESSVQDPKSAFREFPKERRLVRKKSGQLVKSSLKSSKSATRNSLSVVTLPQSSKSEPTTPMQKAVHFDAQLEHVKLFLAEQKPLAVSRDGSPTDDTSGTDSDFPKFIYGEADDRRSRKKLLIQPCNMPTTINPNSDVALESLSLTPDGMSILGRVRVRNIDFSKWIAVRFTFDSWQTTSEVTGRYVESLNSKFDRFSFTIRLNDILPRIEGKTFIMAIRYSVAGQDIWDNNDGQNYLATFTKCKAEAKASPTLSDEEAYTDMANLRSKLEKVSQSDDRSGPAFLAQQPRRESAPTDPDMACFRTSASLASRYDFAASLKSPWDPSKSPPIHHHHTAVKDIQPYTPRTCRGGYFDLTRTNCPYPSPTAFKWTPTNGSVQKVYSDNATFSPPLKFSSFPPADNSSRQMNGDNSHFIVDTGGDSELSTPSLFTPSSSRSSTPSPTEIFMDPLACNEDAQSLSPDTHYRQFINKYMFLIFFSNSYSSFPLDSASSLGKGPSLTNPQSTASHAPSLLLILKSFSLAILHVYRIRQQ